jgi:RecB family exonuclease
VVHNALAQWWRVDLRERTVDRIRRLVDEYWTTEGFRDHTQAEQWRSHAREMAASYVEGLDPHDEPIGVERTVATIHGGAALSGRVDRIDQRGSELVVVDYKTGQHLLSTDDVRSSLALAVYAAAATRTLRKRCRTVELHHLPSGEVVSWTHDDHALERHLGRADDVAAECERADAQFRDGDAGDKPFEARPSPLCGWCDFRAHCPEGQSASVAKAPWAALPQL